MTRLLFDGSAICLVIIATEPIDLTIGLPSAYNGKDTVTRCLNLQTAQVGMHD